VETQMIEQKSRHNPDLDRLPAMRLPADYRAMSETILSVVRASPPGAVFLTFKDDAEPYSGFDHVWRWGCVPDDPALIRRTLRALRTLGFTRVCDGGVFLGKTQWTQKQREIEARLLEAVMGRPWKAPEPK
jgi:hypothetical protein